MFIYVYFNILDSNIATADIFVISAEIACQDINSQTFNEDFYLPLYLPLCMRPCLKGDERWFVVTSQFFCI